MFLQFLLFQRTTWYELLSNYSSNCSLKGEIPICFLTKNRHSMLLEVELKKCSLVTTA